MMRRLVWVAGLWISCWAGLAQAANDFDVVHTQGKEAVRQGVLQESDSPLKVILKQNGVDREIPINEVKWIDFMNTPSALNTAARSASENNLKELKAALGRVPAGNLSGDAAAEMAYLEAYAAARSALLGDGDLRAAATALVQWNDKNPKHYRHLQACELLGDLAAALGNTEGARKFYGEVAAVPIPEYRLRAAVALGRAYLSQGKLAEADKAFDVGLTAGAQGETADVLIAIAKIGKAQCLGDKDSESAIKSIKEAIEDIPASDAEMSARAFNALGNVFEIQYGKSKKPDDLQEAFFAFLKVDMLYSDSGDSHAEALFHLVKIWTVKKKAERAREALENLQKLFPNSRFTSQAAAYLKSVGN